MSPPRRRDRRAGFTLIETLVALIVFAVVAVVAQRGIVTTRLGLDRARSTLAAEQVARSIIETELPRLVRGPGEVSGEKDGLAWSITADPLVLPLPPAPPRPERERGGRAPQQGEPGRTQTQGQGQGQAQTPDQAAEPDIVWRLLRVRVSVANGRGRPLMVETVQVVKAEPSGGEP